MNTGRLFIASLVVITTLILSLDNSFLPRVEEIDSKSFSAQRVKADIKVISKEPHSIDHPFEREIVRNYLSDRLAEIGMDVTCYRYDSIQDRFKRSIDIANLYAVSEPVNRSAGSYVMLIAHIDSRFKSMVNGREEYSFGAADDGYGLGVILEVVNNAQKYRDKWIQGIKVLFTDSEESNLEGIKNAIKHDSLIFNNVGFIINIEARGVKGAAILFETSAGNRNIIDLYKRARYPYAYSLTTAIYRILPNNTDFTIVKDRFPGMNFAVIDNLNYYHTKLDNFENISLKSIQHYGDQIEPIVEEYLINPKYSQSDYLKSDKDLVFFSLPYLGLITLTPNIYLILKLIAFILLLFSLLINIKLKKFSSGDLIKISLILVGFILLCSFVGYSISRLAATLNDMEFRFQYLPYIKSEYPIIAAFLLFIFFIFLLLYRRITINMRLSANAILTCGSLLLIILSTLMFYYTGDSALFFVPVLISLPALFTSRFKDLRFLNIIFIVLIIMFITPLMYSLIVALTIGSLILFSAIFIMFLWILAPIADSFLRDV
ncbi:MAG: hypothetical protein CVU13_02800 [Bacteroidetes bacterium HGW-Bacteroidetes-8]|jgi:hypothetical protein|nr:MAG: hypothetical protein CVU13_02800 [Bacteroidetes bacterium HGW-Bacteroidetes-8]